MIWDGKEIKTFGDVMDVMSKIYEANDADAAQKFMEMYREEEPEVADKNVGYLTGYMDAKTMAGMQKLFAVKHPIFGNKIPTATEAFKAGASL